MDTTITVRLEPALRARLELVRDKLQAEQVARFGEVAATVSLGQVIRLAIHQLVTADAKAGE